ncbi:MAG TPA: glycosyltransferase family 2 protein [Solirubrobacteraceae bacterium]
MVPPDPLISVVLPVFDARPHLAEAVASVRAQSHRRWELLLVDDGSTDGSAQLADALAAEDRRIRVLRVDHGGAAHAVNAGIEAAQGEMIARMDADDVAAPERFATQLEWMRQTGVEVCGSCAMRFGAARGLLWFPEGHEAIAREMLFRHGILQPTLLTHASILKAHRYREGARFEGNELWIRLRREHVLGNVPAVLLKHRVHAQQTSVVRGAAMREFVRATRRPLFAELFPDAGAPDFEAVDRVADRRPFPTLEALERAGSWLLRLADSPDRQLGRRMLARWRDACRASTALGPAVHGLYRRLAPAFVGEPVEPDPRLRLASAVRLPPRPRRRTLRSGRS